MKSMNILPYINVAMRMLATLLLCYSCIGYVSNNPSIPSVFIIILSFFFVYTSRHITHIFVRELSPQKYYTVILGIFILFFIFQFLLVHLFTPELYADYVVVKEQAIYMADEFRLMPKHYEYFQGFPNNINITIILSFFYKICDYNYLYVMLLCGTISNITSIFSGLVIKNITNRNVGSLVIMVFTNIYLSTTYFAYAPYTSNVAIIFVILSFYFYTLKISSLKKIILLTIIAIIGSQIKITVLIPFIAIAVIEFLIHARSYEFRKIVLSAGFIVSSFLISNILISNIWSTIGYERDETKERGSLFYILVGQNNNTCGKIDKETWQLGAKKFDTKAERTKYFKNLIIKSVKERGLTGQPRFVYNKILYTYGNVPVDTFQNIPSLYKSFASIRAFLWLLSLFSIVAVVLCLKCKYIYAFLLCILGVISYTTISESESRYVLPFAPLFFVLVGFYFVKPLIYDENSKTIK